MAANRKLQPHLELGLSAPRADLAFNNAPGRLAYDQEFKLSERLLRGLLNSSPVGAFRADVNGRVIYANTQMALMCELTQEEMLTDALMMRIHPEDRLYAYDNIVAPATCGEPSEGQFRILFPDGRIRWIHTQTTPIHDHAGQFLGTVGESGDITDRKEILDELQFAKAAADLASHAKDIFLANISHELRTPLNGVLGMTDLLLDSDLTEDQREMVEIARSSGESLLRVVTDLLDFSSIGNGCLALRAVPFSMNDIIDNAISLAASKARQKGLRLLVTQNSEMPPGFVGDPTRIKQILNNFLDNAIKFADSGDITVGAEASSAGAQKSNLLVAVLDSGPGIAPEMLDRLFLPFTPLDASPTRRHCGMGMGLAMSKCLAELMGGTVGVRTTPGHGSLFWLRLTLPFCEQAPVLALPF